MVMAHGTDALKPAIYSTESEKNQKKIRTNMARRKRSFVNKAWLERGDDMDV